VIYTPLTELAEAEGSELVFNSRSPKVMEVTPTFYKRDGTVVSGDPVQVQSAEIRYVDFRSLLPANHRHEHDWGGMALSYYGGNREMWAQFRFLGVNDGGSVDEFFVVKDEQRADVQQAAWWMPEKSTAIIALGNITDTPTSATVNFGDGDSQTINLAPHGTEIVRHKHDKGDGPESVAINITGMPGSIIPTGLIASKDGSFNSVIRFYDTKRAKQTNLFANGLRLAGVTPHLTLKNTSASPITAQPKFITLDGVAAGAPVVLPDVTLSAGEATEVNLTPLLQAVRSRHDLDVVSVQIANNGEAGSLIGSLYGINNRSGMNYDTPLRDSGPARSMTGTYPWKVSDDFTTVVYITNISDQQAEFVTQINYDNGKFIGTPGKLKPGETAVFDLQKIRDQQMKDNAGHPLPKDVSLGQFMWAVRGVTNGKLLLIGRAEMVSRSQHISTSYSCNNPCPPYYVLTVDGFPGDFEVAESYGNITAWETAYYDSGFSMGPIASYPTWSVDDPIATFDPNGAHSTTMSCTAVGSTYMTAYAYTTENYAWDGLECIDQQSTYDVSETDPMDVRPVISGPTSLWWFNGETPSGYATQITLTTTSDATSWHWAVVSGSSKVSLSNEDTNSVTITSTGKSDTSNDVGIEVSVNGQVSDQYNITVFAPKRLTYVTEGHVHSDAFGYTSLIQYEIRDQFGSLLPSSVPINEHFTTGVINDYAGTDWIRDNREGGISVPPSGWSDEIKGQQLSRNPIPTPTDPCSPLCGTLVHHFNGEWRVGSTTAGNGVLVQTNTWNRFVDHGSHTNRVSPVP
jgi:hypothetical protein